MIAQKRDDLESFIKEQMLGPGACGLRYFSSKVKGELIPNSSSLYVDEVINTTPGSLYSTGILFPQKEEADLHTLDDHTENEKFQDKEDEENNDICNSDLEDSGLITPPADDDDVFSLSQRFPNSIGLSCCLSPDFNNSKKEDLKIIISGRYYKKIDKANWEKIYVRIEDNHDKFDLFFSLLDARIKQSFKYEDGYLSASNSLSSKNYRDHLAIIKSINLQKAEEVATSNDGIVDSIFNEIKDKKYRYLKSYKERLFFHLRKVSLDNDYLSEDEKKSIICRLQKVEMYETFLSYFEDVLAIYNSKGFGFWKCEHFEKEIELSGFSFELPKEKSKKVYKPSLEPALKNVVEFVIDDSTKASLSVWLQLTKDTRNTSNTSTFIKIQIENTSTKFKNDPKHYFSIVTEGVNQLSFFGIEIRVISKYLSPYKRTSELLDPSNENSINQYLYRSIEDYAIGHFCSADWGKTTEDIPFVRTEFIPSCETPDIEANPSNKNEWIKIEKKDVLKPRPYLRDTQCLQFKWLSTFSDAKNEDIRSKLLEFVETYGLWIGSLNHNHSTIAQSNIKNCLEDYERMRTNTEIFLKDEQIMECFRIMNSAMFMQMWHGEFSNEAYMKSRENNSGFDYDFYNKLDDDIFQKGEPATWRPFQLAFILLNLDGIIHRADDILWEKRNEVVDLVWFPTGGGKTEAYLGIIAFAIIYRRRTKEAYVSGGTTAIMRYTLRLLATQQFQRAMRVIFALEVLRSWEVYKLGSEIISIGLFVGKDSLPNSEDDLKKESDEWLQNKESRIPLTTCPWCGQPLTCIPNGAIKDGELTSGNEVIFRCQNEKCSFGLFIPVMLCDEYIYKYPPTLLFGTVDKFAALAHNVSSDPRKKNQDSRRLFGTGIDLHNLTPDLIIQDELHLLLGPLGSAAGLFEAAIDQLCTRTEVFNGVKQEIRPKIISSTATTRNTPLQIRALYDRDVNIFPKNGVDYDDSFFAFYKREAPIGVNPNEKFHFVSKRKYLGILPTGRTQMTTQMRLAAAIFVHRALFEKINNTKINDDSFIKAADYYYSLISYFNSLKEVGKTDAQFYTEFVKYTRRLFKRVLRPSNMLECFYSYEISYSKCELTGRLSGSEVVEQLSKVKTKWNPNTRLPYKDVDGQYVAGVLPPDFIVATNMISVGLDVSRFNTIIINSMPRNIAEYIQASSRVARDNLGLVITLHNPFRSRDLSHFEKFREFHEKMYCYVEPISITPFSNKAIDRFMPLYLATLIRHKFNNLSNRDAAGSLTKAASQDIEKNLLQYFREREKRTKTLSGIENNLLNEDALEYIKQFIEQSFDEWLLKIDSLSETERLVYSKAEYVNNNRRRELRDKDLFVALDAYDSTDNAKNWKVPQSLRTVEPEAIIRIND